MKNKMALLIVNHYHLQLKKKKIGSVKQLTT